MISVSSLGDLRDEYNNIVMTYRNMLSYTIEGINDPERNKIYLKLIQSILELADRCKTGHIVTLFRMAHLLGYATDPERTETVR